MARLELSCRRIALFGGAQVDAEAYAVCVHPGAPALQKRGTLALITEPAGTSAQGEEACKLVQDALVECYFSDRSLGLTGSLLNALEAANNRVLQSNNGWSEHENGQPAQYAKTRKSRVGMTAVLIRPDGAGLYLAQMAPTQAYILHNDVLTALPEPQSWKQQTERPVVTLRRITGADEQGEGESDEPQEDDALAMPPIISDLPEPALPLGSAPGVEADLIYRRIAAGDKVILVSSDLARYIERDWAEQTFAWKDADGIAEALYTLAMERTLAEAHACVLELGVPVSSGVDVDYTLPVASLPAIHVDSEGGATSAPKQPGTLIEALRGPREWLTRRRAEAPQADLDAPQTAEPPAASADDPEDDAHDTDASAIWSRQPTQLFVQRTPELPPYQAHATAQALPSTYDDPDDELQFDGWEDAPPALDNPRFNASHNVVYKPRLLGEAEEVEELPSVYLSGYGAPAEAATGQPNMRIIEDEPVSAPRTAGAIAGDAAKRGMALAGNTLRAMLPDKMAGRVPGMRVTGGGKMQLPLRLVILGVLGLAGIILIFSLISMKGDPQKTAAHNLLTDAQALETSANQPGVADTARLEQLQLALDKAQQAATDDPASQEAATLITKLNGEIDTARGITRLPSLNLLFDLDAIDQAASPISATTGLAPATDPAQAPARGKLDIVGQGNDLYALDHSANRLYRCQIAAGACSPLLNKGDKVDGTTVGDLLAITLRVGSPVVLDTQFVAYVYNADSGSWNAQQLGAADTLQQPTGIATYDGNLYLLGAKPGQISKYMSGQYGDSPTDWITDDATRAAMQSPVAIAIDGAIYVTLADGKILVMQGGKLTSTFTPKSSAGTGDPTQLYTGTDVQNLYLLRSDSGSVTRLDKNGKTLAIWQTPAGSGLTSVSGLAVDEGKNKLYLAEGRKVYEALMPATGTATTQEQHSASQTPLPTVRPTVEP